MVDLRHRELHQLSRALLHIHATRDATDFSSQLLQAMRAVIGADICVVDWNRPRCVGVQTAYDPIGAVPAEVNAAVHRYLKDNPLYGLRKATPVSLSDLLSARRWHATALYAEGYGCLGQQDGLGLDIQFDDGGLLSLVTTRGRRGYSSSDRTKLAALGAHVRHVYARLNLESQQHVGMRPSPLSHRLTVREREVLMHTHHGMRNAEIGELLGIRPGTVKRHLENVYEKLGVSNRRDALELVRSAS